MMDDRRGVPVSTDNARSLETFGTALTGLNTYWGDPVAAIDMALQADLDFFMGHILRAEAHLTMWERSVIPEIAASLVRLTDLDSCNNDRERRHVRAWPVGIGRLGRHAGQLDRLLAAYPRAEETGRQAIEIEPDDCWAQHVVAHVMEMQASSRRPA